MLLQVFFDLGRTNFGGASKIHHLDPLILQEVKLAFPIISHDKGVNVIFMDVCALLFPVLLWDYQVDVANCLQQLLSLLIGEVAFLPLFIPVELIGRKHHHQIVTKCFCAT